jgi:hypothetical protein
MNYVEFGTHRSVRIVAGRREVIRHNPPRRWQDVLTDYASELDLRRWAKDLVQPFLDHEPFPSNHILIGDVVDRGVLATMAHTTSGQTADEAAAFQSICGQAYPASNEQPEPTPVRVIIIPDVHAPHSRDSKPRRRVLTAAEARNVLDNPLLRLPGTTSGIVRSGISLRRAEETDATRPSLGQYRDFRDAPRSLPQFNPHTIMGVLRQEGALGDSSLDEETLKRMAVEASRYRRQQGISGGNAGPEGVELYIRIFRALGLDREGLSQLTADALERMYLAYLRVHAA